MKITTFNDKYKIIKKISKEENSDIYEIKDKKVKSEYILKKIKKENQELFEKEIEFLLDVKGTNIINIIDFYINKKENCYELILEKMDGDLNMMLKNYKNGMPPNLIRKIFSQINSGLKIINKNGMAHRDLKPSNILFSYTNEEKTDFIVKICDFGFAKSLKSTKEGTNLGTYQYKAPEIRGEEPKYSNKCDLYSIGIILYVLKTGDKYCKNIIDFFADLKKKTIKNETDDEKLNNLIKQLVVSDPHKRMEWKNYFNDPFFKVNDEVFKDNEECKKILIKLR